ncbi:hypothetical protein [Mycobacterium sp. NPDC050041]|uniref:hypothetical protein n=1 Tax=Mycobacterium sp. NPDC050041 TaxID=3364293 RepID=UPI003C2C737F
MVIGRGLFVPLGWMVVFGVLASPVLVICLGITSLMMRRPPGRELTAVQAWAQIAMWAAMFGFGLTCVDGGDSGTTGSVLTTFFGDGSGVETLSGLLWYGCIAAGIVAWFVLLITLSRRPAATPLPQQPYPYPPTP